VHISDLISEEDPSMHTHRITFVAFVALSLATSTSLISQSQAPYQPDRLTVMGVGVFPPTENLTAGRSAPDAVALGLASAKVYRFATADYPGASQSLVFDENTSTGTVVGDSKLTNSFGFTLHGGAYTAFSVPGSTSNLTTGINTSGEVVGVYTDQQGNTLGFLDNGGTFTTLDLSGASVTQPTDINDSGEIVGEFQDALGVHGFLTLDNGTTFTELDAPGATSTQAGGLNTTGVIVGAWIDASGKNHGFIYKGGTFTSLDLPLATGTVAIGINDSNKIAGYFTDASNMRHGFIYFDGAFTQVDVVGASGTQLTRIKNKGQITGAYNDSLSEQHGITGH